MVTARSISVGSVFEEARRVGSGFRTITASDDIDELPYPRDARARLRAALSDGTLVAVAPMQAVRIGGTERVGWWLVDPRTGALTTPVNIAPDSPTDIAFDAAGNLVIVSVNSEKITSVNPRTGAITPVLDLADASYDLSSVEVERGGAILIGDGTGARVLRYAGGTLTPILQNDPELAHIPVVFLSAKGQEAEVRTGLEAGAVEYILKPFSPDQLAARIQTILDGAV